MSCDDGAMMAKIDDVDGDDGGGVCDGDGNDDDDDDGTGFVMCFAGLVHVLLSIILPSDSTYRCFRPTLSTQASGK